MNINNILIQRNNLQLIEIAKVGSDIVRNLLFYTMIL